MAPPNAPKTSTPNAVAATTGVVLINDDQQTPAESYGYTVALGIAATSGVPITLYDRSEETWGDSQHPEGPLCLGDDRLGERPELSSQLAWIEEHDVPAQSWVSTLPSISAVLTALSQLGADVVVVPDTIDRKLFERVLEGGSLATSLAEQVGRNPALDVVVLEVDENGATTRVAR